MFFCHNAVMEISPVAYCEMQFPQDMSAWVGGLKREQKNKTSGNVLC